MSRYSLWVGISVLAYLSCGPERTSGPDGSADTSLDVDLTDGADSSAADGDADDAPDSDVPQPLCGQGPTDAPLCSPQDVGDHTCQSQGFAQGELLCTEHCVFDTSACFGDVEFPNVAVVDMDSELFSGPDDAGTYVMVDIISDFYTAFRPVYDRYADSFDFLMLFYDFPFDNGQGWFAASAATQGGISGIGLPAVFDRAADAGSDGELDAAIMMMSTEQYPAGPQGVVAPWGTNAVESLAHEVGHRWLAYANVIVDPGASDFTGIVDGLYGSHWSFGTHSGGSVMFGNILVDQGDGSFCTQEIAQLTYSSLDLYLMGLLAPSEVEPFFVVADASEFDPPRDFLGQPFGSSSPPQAGVCFSGARFDLTADDLIDAVGSRSPDALSSQKDFTAAFVLMTRPGARPRMESLELVEEFRLAWEQWFSEHSRGLGTMQTNLDQQHQWQ